MPYGYDLELNNEYIDLAEEVIQTPPPEDVRLIEVDELRKRLDSIQAPRERLKSFLISLVDVSGTGTHEGYYVRTLFVFGLFGGWMFGGLFKNKNLHQDFIRQNNAAAFEHRFVAQRKLNDTYLYNVATKGARFGLSTALLMAAGGTVCIGSTSYRNDLYLPDWILGLGAVGAVSRCWLGLRGATAGALIGSSTGLALYGLTRGYEAVTGDTVVRRRYLYHKEWMANRDARLDRLKRMREEYEKKYPRL